MLNCFPQNKFPRTPVILNSTSNSYDEVSLLLTFTFWQCKFLYAQFFSNEDEKEEESSEEEEEDKRRLNDELLGKIVSVVSNTEKAEWYPALVRSI